MLSFAQVQAPGAERPLIPLPPPATSYAFPVSSASRRHGLGEPPAVHPLAAATPVQAASTLRSLLASAPIATWRPEGASQRSQATLLLCLGSPGTFHFTQNRIKVLTMTSKSLHIGTPHFLCLITSFLFYSFLALSLFLKCAGYSLASGPLHLLL